jgi:NTE family protein
MRSLPDVLVCGVGGTLGEAWMRGLLDGLSAGSGLDFRRCEQFVGTSAGSIVAASLAGGRAPQAGDAAARAWAAAAPDAPDVVEAPPRPRGRLGTLAGSAARAGVAALGPLAPAALAGAAPAGAAVRRAALSAVPRGTRRLDGLGTMLDALGASFDGRLRIAAVDLATGRRVVFGAPGSPPAAVRDAVLASCAIPGVFAPVAIDGREYVDGGVWSPLNLDAAAAGRGARVLCLAASSAAGPLRGPTSAAATAETLVLRGRGADVEVVSPDGRARRAMGPRLMDAGRSEGVLAAGYAQGRELAVTAPE